METFFNKTDKLYDVVVIRSLAILLVVAFHAYGLMMTDAIFQNAQVYRDMYSNLNNIVLAFRMPLFIFISGYLFSHLENDRGKYATFRGLVSNKFKRLIIPYFVFVTLMMLGMNDFHVSTYWQMNYYHLWFIPMLFWCFVFCRVQSFLPFCKSATFKIAMLCLFGGLASAGSRIELPNFLGINYFLIWFFWFFLGYNIYLQRDRVYGFLSHSRWILFVFLAVYSIGVYYRCTVEHNKLIMTISNLGFVFFLWYIINRLINLRGGVEWMQQLNKYSYGIYVFHFLIQIYLVSNTAKRLFNLPALADEYLILFPLLFFIISFFVSMVLTYLFLKTKVGRFLIG